LVTHRWWAQDYETVDGMPYVGGLSPRHDRILVATGFRKWGMTNGTATAMILADRILDRDNPWAEAFDSTRLAPGASIKSLVTENVNVGKRLVGDRLRSLAPRDADRLAAGEGGIVDLHGKKAAAYRDDSGALYAVSPTCTHLGCLVTFNTAERSWDCPCHGSRFGIDGRVIAGPATADLEVRGPPGE
jgi:Rieske Fe-S protein